MSAIQEQLVAKDAPAKMRRCIGPLPYIRAQILILQFYFKWIPRFGRIHPDLLSGKLFSETLSMSSDRPYEVSLDAGFEKEFNAAYEQLKDSLAGHLGLESDFLPILFGCWGVRVAQGMVVWTFGPFWGLLAGLAQFVVAPLSFTSSIVRLLTNASDCVVHYVLNALMLLLVLLVLFVVRRPESFETLPKISVDLHFVAWFFILDFCANMYHYMLSSEGFGLQRLLVHIFYGSFNTKTYFVIVLGCLFGIKFDLVTILLTGMLQYLLLEYGYQTRLLSAIGLPCFGVTFYIEHRIGHCPVVYSHAHKMHHYLHDTTAFDAHIYGNGMNEEFCWILAETLPCLASGGLLFPYWLNPYVLYVSWTNKSSHTRTVDNEYIPLACDADNFHADHHTFHRANFGLSTNPLLDFYFGTQGATTKRVEHRSWELRPDPENSEKMIMRVAPMEKEVIDTQAPPLLRRGSSIRIQGVSGTHMATSLNGATGVLKEFDEASGRWIIALEDGRTRRMKPDNIFDANVGADLEPAAAESSSLPPGDWRLRTISQTDLVAKKTAAAGGPWVAMHGVVFDLRIFHRIHPGGPAVLLQYAGSDATRTFDEIGHSAKGLQMAKKYAIGRLEGTSMDGFMAE